MGENRSYEGFALVELMGHRQRVGYVTEVEMYGGRLLRIDIPILDENTAAEIPQLPGEEGQNDGWATEFYGTASIYSLRPVTAEVAFDLARSYGDPRPARPMGYRAIAQRPGAGDDEKAEEAEEAPARDEYL